MIFVNFLRAVSPMYYPSCNLESETAFSMCASMNVLTFCAQVLFLVAGTVAALDTLDKKPDKLKSHKKARETWESILFTYLIMAGLSALRWAMSELW